MKNRPTAPQPNPQSNQNPGDAETIPINGFQQIVDMLKIADPAFRESLLKRLAQRDHQLARSLRRDLETKR